MSLINKYILFAAAIITLSLIVSCTNSNDPKSSSQTGITDLSIEGRQMPFFNLPSLKYDRSATTSESLNGKVVLVTFFASWCRSCLEEIPLLIKLHDRYSHKDFAIIAMAIDHENEVGLVNLIQNRNINYQVLLADEAVKRDFGGISILPTMFLVDREGKLIKKYSGHINRDSLNEDIEQLLKR